MTILFYIALILAIPTMGISILAYLILFISKSFLTARIRIHDANVRRASNSLAAGRKELPSWSKDKDKIKAFKSTLKITTRRRGVPDSFLDGA